MTNSRYNAHTEPLFKQLHLLKVKDIFEIQCLKFWYKYVNNKLPNYFRNMFTNNHELHEIETRNHDRLHLYPTRTSGARNILRHHIPELLNKFPLHLVDRFKTHSLYSVSHHIKCYLIDLYSYDCDEIDCYICNNNWAKNRWFCDLGAVSTLWSLTMAQVVAITTSTASIDMGWFDVTVFPYRSCTKATISQIFVTGRTGGCQNDNFQYSRWW